MRQRHKYTLLAQRLSEVHGEAIIRRDEVKLQFDIGRQTILAWEHEGLLEAITIPEAPRAKFYRLHDIERLTRHERGQSINAATSDQLDSVGLPDVGTITNERIELWGMLLGCLEQTHRADSLRLVWTDHAGDHALDLSCLIGEGFTAPELALFHRLLGTLLGKGTIREKESTL